MQVRPQTSATASTADVASQTGQGSPLRISRESIGLSLGRLGVTLSSEKVELDPASLSLQSRSAAEGDQARTFASILAAAKARAGSYTSSDAPLGRLGVMRRGLAAYAQAALEGAGAAPASLGFAAVI